MAPETDNPTPGGTDMARWIPQTLHVSDSAEILIGDRGVWIGHPDDDPPTPATFDPKDREEANSMAIALRLAAKRLEEIGKEMA